MRVPANQINTIPSERMYERRKQIDIEGAREPDDIAAHELSEQEQRESDEQILAVARKRFQMSMMAENTLRQEMMEDLRFRAGEQWPDQIRADRVNDKRPILTINRIPQFIKQITNPQRQIWIATRNAHLAKEVFVEHLTFVHVKREHAD